MRLHMVLLRLAQQPASDKGAGVHFKTDFTIGRINPPRRQKSICPNHDSSETLDTSKR